MANVIYDNSHVRSTQEYERFLSDDSPEARSTKSLNLEPNDAGRLATLCGPLDQNIRQLENRLGIHIRNRGHDFQLEGPSDGVRKGEALITHLYAQLGGGGTLDPKTLHLYLQDMNLGSLPPGVFDGQRLWNLDLSDNNLTSLPPGLFNGSVLRNLDLTGNPGAPFALSVGLERTDGAPRAASFMTRRMTHRISW